MLKVSGAQLIGSVSSLCFRKLFDTTESIVKFVTVKKDFIFLKI